MSKLNLVILGGGNGPHCYAGIASTQPDVEVRVLSLFQDEAARWSKAMEGKTFEVTFNNWEQGNNKVFSGKPAIVSNDPAKTIPGAHLIVFMVPAFAHGQYFTAIEPHLKDDVIICGAPGACGFVFQAVHALGAKLKKCCLLSFESLPWACRLTEFGRSATVFAGKDMMTGGGMGDLEKKSVIGKNAVQSVEHTLLYRPRLILQGHILGDTIVSPNAITHPSIEYGQWHDWDGKPVKEAPDFYHGVTHLGADMVNATSKEVVAIRHAIEKARPDIDLSQVVDSYGSFLEAYPNDIKDKSSLYAAFRSHQGYTGIKHPMVKLEGGLAPDFRHRYFLEDIPFGLVVLRGIAEIMQVPTPNIDTLIVWGQQKMKKEYLVDGKLTGKDLNESRCPQKFGISTLQGMLGD